MNNALKLEKPTYHSKYFVILTMLFLTIMLGTYVLSYKMVSIGGIVFSGGILIFPINYAIIDVISEVYGFKETKKLIMYSFFCCFFFAIIVPLISLLPYPNDWSHQSSYNYVCGKIWRFFLANTTGIIIGITLNAYLIARWKIILKGKHFWLRSIGSSTIGELITSIIADILAFFGTMKITTLLNLMLSIYFIKLFYAIILAFPISLFVIHIKLKEGKELFYQNQLI